MFDREYYIGATKSSYEDYANCRGVLETYAGMLSDILSPASIFDAGCAYGFLVDWFNRRGTPAAGCDLSGWAAAQSPAVIQCSILELAENMPILYDVVTCSEVLEHIPESDVGRALENLWALVRPGGVLVLLIGMFPEGTLCDPADSTHCTFHERAWWEEQVDVLGGIPEVREARLNDYAYSREMRWDGRFIVVSKPI
jgi:SAM-dependent methyltransferase